MARLLKTAARHAASNVIMVITNPAILVWLINARIAQSNVMGEPHRRVPAVYGKMAQHVQRIRFVAEAVVQPVLRVSMFIRILAKTIA